jgi:hypothetical protein
MLAISIQHIRGPLKNVTMPATAGGLDGLQIEVTEIINRRMARTFPKAFTFPPALVIPKTNDNYPRRVLEKLMDCVEI